MKRRNNTLNHSWPNSSSNRLLVCHPYHCLICYRIKFLSQFLIDVQHLLFYPQSRHFSLLYCSSIYGAGSCAEWAAEGRRLVPLMPRLVPQTVFSSSATAAANSAAAANAKLPVSSGNVGG